MPTLLVVDDSAVVRRAIREFLAAADSSWIICGEAEDAEKGFEMCVQLQPDIALIDLSLPPQTGLSLVKRLKQTNTATKIAVMSEQEPTLLATIAKTYGVPAVAKSLISSRLIPVLEEALQGTDS